MKTKFGNAKINDKGYYQITSRKECNHGKMLHRLIFEDFYGYIPKNYHVHHKDGNKLNNCIMNLQLLHKSEHLSYHKSDYKPSVETRKKISEANKGNKNNMFGKHHSVETRKKMSEARKGKVHSDETKLKISKSKNTTGYYHVSKKMNNKYKQGFYYQYHYYENNKDKRISSISIDKLEEKVKNKGLEWRKI